MQIAQQIGLAAPSTTSRRSAWTTCAPTSGSSPRTPSTGCSTAGATVYGPKDVEDRGGAVSFWFRDVHPHDLAQVLNEEGVASVRVTTARSS